MNWRETLAIVGFCALLVALTAVALAIVGAMWWLAWTGAVWIATACGLPAPKFVEFIGVFGLILLVAAVRRSR